MIRISIVGATGYSGGELIKLLLQDAGVRIQHVTSESSSGRLVSDVHSSLRNRIRLKFEKLNIAKIVKDTDLVFSCLPAGVGIKSTAKFIKAGVKVIDLSGDFRLPTPALYKTWYKKSHSYPSLLKSKVYGLPELNRNKIKKASLVANPGCYATAAILSIAPLLKPLLVNPKTLIIDAKSGVSGAGKKVAKSMIFNEVNESLMPYAITVHRHQPEIETVLKTVSPKGVQVTFTPHLVPMERGIISVLYGSLKKTMSLKSLRALYLKKYEHEPFVRVLPEGEIPNTKNVKHTNYCDIGVFIDRRMHRVIVVSAIDNLGKGAASQAVQNMNLMFNRSEVKGLL